MNLPNAITVSRIALTPMIAWLPFSASTTWRLAAFLLFLAAAISDYWDGYLARSRNVVTDLGRILDPLADKLLLVATLLPMYLLQHSDRFIVSLDAVAPDASPFLFVTPIGRVSLPLWIVLVVVGRELFMTFFRQIAARSRSCDFSDWAGQVEDDVSEYLDGCGVLLVFHCHVGNQGRGAGLTGVAPIRDVQRAGWRAGDDACRGVHAVVPVLVLAAIWPTRGASGDVTLSDIASGSLRSLCSNSNSIHDRRIQTDIAGFGRRRTTVRPFRMN